jgi:hypothetical protein
MKKLLLFLFIFFEFYAVQAQPHLSISSLTGQPFNPGDSAYEVNSYDSIRIVVVNQDSFSLTDNIQILLQSDSMPLDTLYTDPAPSTILPYDSVVLIKNGYILLSSHFDDGDNIIVVWPRAMQTPVQSDSITMHVYFISINADVGKIKNEVMTIYPNPVNNYIAFRVPEGIMIKQVRISDSSGKLIYHNSSIQKFISTENWPAGMYFIEVEKSDGSVQKLRLIKN